MRISDWSSDVCSSDLLIVSEVNRQHEIVIRQIGRAEPRLRDSDPGGATRQRWRTLLTCFGWQQIGRAHVWTPVTNAHLVCRLLLEKKKKNDYISHADQQRQPPL